MRVLVVGPYRDGTGYAHACVDAILALVAAGCDVACRPVKLNRASPAIPPRVAELEVAGGGPFDATLLCGLPPMFDRIPAGGTHAGMYFVETSNFRDAGWGRHVNLMDLAVVACEHNRLASLDSGVTAPLAVVPCATDVSRFARGYPPHPLRERLGRSFAFYTIGEWTRRKNFAALVQAFHLEFSPAEPVELVIKTSVPGAGPDEARALVHQHLDEVKRGLHLYADPSLYRREHVITEHFSDEGIARLHASCDCFVSTSYGEGWGIPAFDAMGYGKTPIASRYGAYEDYLDEDVGWPVPGHMVPVAGMLDAAGGLYSARSRWFQVDVEALRRAMREAYECGERRRTKSEAGLERVFEYSHEKIGRRLRAALEGS